MDAVQSTITDVISAIYVDFPAWTVLGVVSVYVVMVYPTFIAMLADVVK